MNFKDFQTTNKKKIDAALEELFSETDGQIYEMMKYSLLSPGKRIRPMLTLLAAQSLGKVIDDETIKAALGVELVHAYSLVHDDLPAMDADETRRGLPTSWKKYGDGNAVLVGDGLLTWSFKLLSDLNLSEEIRLKLISNLALAAGPDNLIKGQQQDLFSSEVVSNIEDVEYLYLLKTGSLLAYAISAGAILAKADDDIIRKLNVFALNFGIAFQLKDDLDDAGSEIDATKNTALKYLDKKQTQDLIDEHKEIARKALSEISDFNTKAWDELLASL